MSASRAPDAWDSGEVYERDRRRTRVGEVRCPDGQGDPVK